MRVGRTMKVLDSADAAVLVVDSSRGLCPADEELCGMFRKKEIPFVVALNKDDLGKGKDITAPEGAAGLVRVSAATGEGIHELKEKIARLISDAENSRRIIADLISPRDVIVLVVPIDSAAPKGRLILPQQQTIRDILQAGAMPIVCRDTELTATLNSLAVKPRIVVTDSQAFGKVSKLTPDGHSPDLLLHPLRQIQRHPRTSGLRRQSPPRGTRRRQSPRSPKAAPTTANAKTSAQ